MRLFFATEGEESASFFLTIASSDISAAACFFRLLDERVTTWLLVFFVASAVLLAAVFDILTQPGQSQIPSSLYSCRTQLKWNKLVPDPNLQELLSHATSGPRVSSVLPQEQTGPSATNSDGEKHDGKDDEDEEDHRDRPEKLKASLNSKDDSDSQDRCPEKDKDHDKSGEE